ncbi:murein L,D-transpeptidase catalytic domain family protein [Rufibacter immobilis]|uniref:murein L,D-transpeptidase catalytic domain family protein n=1 Tax=Rufibacter immobilis TaxID=1348778 RepID=UPI0035E551FB
MMTGNNLIKYISFIMAVFAVAFTMGFVLKQDSSLSVKAGATLNKLSVVSLPLEKNSSETDSTPKALFERYVVSSYKEAGLAGEGLSLETYREAVTGYHNLMSDDTISQDKPLITIVDFNQSSKARRLWVIDLATNRVVYNTWVAHGQGSGGEFATAFSNTPNSYQSSLGFYVTQGTYFGKNGLSLKLKGLDSGFNINAFSRYIVVHGAAYAGEDFIKKNGRLGRSQGCPALPLSVAKPIIDTIKNKTVLYIDGPSSTYSSSYLNAEQAALCFSADERGKGHLQV